MDSVDPGAYLASLGGSSSSAAPVGDIDSQIMTLLRQTAPPADPGNDSSRNAQLAQSVTAKGSNRLTTWLKNAPMAAGGEFTRLGMGLAGKKMDPLMQSVFDADKNASPGVAPLTDVLATAPAAMAAGEAVPAAAARYGIPALKGLAASPVGMGAVQGGVQGLLTADPGQRLQGGLLGAATGGVVPAVGSAVGKLATGLTRTPEAQNLVSQGLNLPMGMLNPSGPMNKLEQAFTHIPFVGSKIANARAAVPAQVTERMVQDAAAPGAQLAPGIGGDINEAVSQLKDGFENAYQTTLGTKGTGFPVSAQIMNTVGANVPLGKAFQAVAATPRLGLDAATRASLGKQLQAQLNETLAVARRTGGLEATDLQGLRSAIRDAGRDVSPVDNASRALKGFWSDAEDRVTAALKSQLPPDTSAALDQIDQQYGKFATVRGLAASVKDRTPTINDWSNAIARSTPPNVYAAGGGWNRGLVNSAAQVAKATVAHTGALGAGTIAPAVGALGAGIEAGLHPAFVMAHPAAFGGTAAAIGGLYGAYTQPGMRFLAGQTGPQKAVQGLLSRIPQGVGRAGSLATRSALIQGLLSSPAVQAATQ